MVITRIKIVLLWALILCMSGCEKENLTSQPKDIVVSIKPLYGLVAKVIEGTKHTVTLLFDGTTSPHTTGLTLKETARLKNCDAFFWIGACYEMALSRHVHILPHAIDLSKNPRLTLLPTRTFDTECDHHTCDHHHDVDGHYWMAIDNATAMVRDIGAKLTNLCPEDKETFEKNIEKACSDLKIFSKNLKNNISPTVLYYRTSHDFAQYAENLLHIHCISIESSGHHGTTLQQALSDKVNVFITEPHTRIPPSSKESTIITLDYLGKDSPLNLHCYEHIMEAMALHLQAYRRTQQ